MTLQTLKKIFSDYGCSKLFIKKLSPNDNSKNQVYFGGSFEALNIFPIKNVSIEQAGDWKKERFKASIDFAWVTEGDGLSPAPRAQLILYPKYPEVRFSGFLTGSANPPSELMSQRLSDRLLILGVTSSGKVLGYVVSPRSSIAREIFKITSAKENGIFLEIDLQNNINNREKLISELIRIHNMGWIDSKRLDGQGRLLECNAPNCGGYTLEAELGITPNGYSEPDYLGWEIKQFGVANFNRISSAIITLMTPEPTDGIYKTGGAEKFIRLYGYPDKSGKADRYNFGGIHKIGIRHPSTQLEMQLIGFDIKSNKIRSTDGRIALIDKKGVEAASWSFSSLLLHWNRKHNKACYVPSMSDKISKRKYSFGNRIILGQGTDFQLFLSQMAKGNIYYDPGIKVESMSKEPKVKKRSQFRVKSSFLPNLYNNNELIDITL
jgi:hypothetical protein